MITFLIRFKYQRDTKRVNWSKSSYAQTIPPHHSRQLKKNLLWGREKVNLKRRVSYHYIVLTMRWIEYCEYWMSVGVSVCGWFDWLDYMGGFNYWLLKQVGRGYMNEIDLK